MIDSLYDLRHRPEMSVDALSDMLAAFDARCRISGGIAAGGDWAIRFAPPETIKFNIVIEGECWLEAEGCGPPVRMRRGDVCVVNGLHPLRLGSDMAVAPVDADKAFAEAEDNIARLGQEGGFQMLGGHVMLDPVGFSFLARELPPTIHIAGDAPKAGILAWLLERLLDETVQTRAGGSAVTAPLAQLLFVFALRDYIERGGSGTGWLSAAGDRRIAPVLGLMHSEPARNWRLQELAQAAGMSRSSFAERFRAVCGMAPLSYLAIWRMRLAERALREGATLLTELAGSVGYASESAFSTAFKRIVGMSPAHYRNWIKAGNTDARYGEQG